MARHLSLAAFLVVLCAAAPARAAAPPVDFVGLNDWSHPTAQTLDQLGSAGLKNWRIPLSWATVESVKGKYAWSGYDQLVKDAATHGIRVLFVISSCPAWACADDFQPPATAERKSALREFSATAAARYGNLGTFWLLNPTVPKIAVTHWQVWNEVNEERNLKSGEPAEYLELLRTVAGGLKSKDPEAKIVISGLVEKGTPKWLNEWLPAFYKLDPNVKNEFDVMAVHGYSADPEGFFSILDLTRRIMKEAGDDAKRLWVTEVGWGSEGPQHPFSPGLDLQKAYVRQALDTAVACRSRWKLDRVFYFALHNGDPTQQGLPDYWGFHNGLLYTDGTAKPAFTTFMEYVGGNDLGRADTCDLPGGETIPDAPTDFYATKPSFYYKELPVTLKFDPPPGKKLVCYFETNPPVDCTDGYTTPSDLVEGIYKLTIKMLDENSNIISSNVFGFLLDLSPPRTVLTSPGPNVSRTINTALTFTWVAVDDGGVGEDYECRLDDGAWTACMPPVTTPLGLPDGRHTFYVRSIDYAGNAEATPLTQVFFVDTTAPDTKISRPPPFTAPIAFNDLHFEFFAYAKNATFECRLDAAPEWFKCVSPQEYTDLPDGAHTFEVRALDPTGNADQTPDSRTFTIDTAGRPQAPFATARQWTLKKARRKRYFRALVRVVAPDTTIKLQVIPWKSSRKKVVAKGTFKNVPVGKRELRPRLTKLGRAYLKKPRTRRFKFLLESRDADGRVAKRSFSGRLR